MHESVAQFVIRNVRRQHVEGRSVLEVGSYNVNGSIRPFVEALRPSRYVGVDIAPGPGVDVVCAAENLPDEAAADLVVSCEMLEHAEDWKRAFVRMTELVAVDGRLVLTCRGPGFPFHNPPDHWRFTCADLSEAARACGLAVVSCERDPQVPGAFLVAERRGPSAAPTRPEELLDVARAPLGPVGKGGR